MAQDLTVSPKQIPATVYATTPEGVAQAHSLTLDHIRGRLLELAREADETRAAIEAAERGHLNPQPFRRVLRRVLNKAVYFRKVEAAVEAGYLLMPPFDVTVFAVRPASDKKPRGKWSQSVQTWEPGGARPLGSGAYVQPRPFMETVVRRERKSDGTDRDVLYYKPIAHDTRIDFPFTVVKPHIIDATNRAMAMKIFDEVGTLPQSRAADPVVVGRIRRPATGTSSWAGGYLHFMVAWWLDLKELG